MTAYCYPHRQLQRPPDIARGTQTKLHPSSLTAHYCHQVVIDSKGTPMKCVTIEMNVSKMHEI